ncbi:MAG: EAL domain-containing protein [Geminicoccaceae bacterium]
MLDDPDLRLLLDLAPSPLLLLQRVDRSRPAPTIRLVNRALFQLVGPGAETLANRSLRSLAALLEPDAEFVAMLAAAARGEPFSGSIRLRNDAGSASLTAHGAPLASREGYYTLWLSPRAPPVGRAAPSGQGETFRLLAGLSGDCFYELAVEVDCSLRLVWADSRLAEITGYDPDELRAMGGFFALVADQDRAELQRRNQRLLVNQPGPVRYRLRHRDGELRWVLDHARAVRRAEDAAVGGVVGTLTGLSPGTPVELPRAALEREAALLADTMAACLAVVDPAGRVLWAGDGSRQPVGRRLHELVGESLGSDLPPHLRDLWLDWIGEAAAVRQPLRCRLGWPDGEKELSLEALLVPLSELQVQIALWPAVVPRMEMAAARPLLEALPAPMLLAGADGQIVEVNSAFERLIGATRAEVIGRPVAERLAVGGGRDALATAFDALVQGREREARLALPIAARGGERQLDLRLVGLAAEAGVLIEANRVEDRAQSPPSSSESWLAAVMSNVTDGIILLDREGTVTWLSRSAEAILDYPRDAAIGAHIDVILPLGGSRADRLLDRVQRMTEGPAELALRRRSGEIVPVEVEASIAELRERRMVVLVLRDLTGRQQTEETLRSLAYHDALTGLPNRLLFHDRLAQAIERARRARQLLTVMLIDLDRFKLINDSLGLVIGDQLIKGVADRLVQVLRKSDTVGRLGGDEFMVLLLGTNGAEAAARVAQKLLEVLRPPLQIEGHELTTSASMGIALFPHDGDDADALIKNAANALGRAKEQGRNHYQFYTEDMNAKAFERLMLESGLRKALEQGELVLHYQPKVSLADGAVTGVEALLRWVHPDFGVVPPAEFIPLAEETGLIVPIGAWVLRTACAQVHAWHRAGHAGLDLAVNISARQFQERSFVPSVAAALAETGFPAERIELELTESVIMRDALDVAQRLRELTALGIRLAVDDFGTGYSSLGYLRSFPIHALKIDRSFVRDIDRDPSSAALAQAIIAMAASLELQVVAEGVETRAQLEQLHGFGCRELQGYIFSKPLPPEELLALLDEGRRLPLPAH